MPGCYWLAQISFSGSAVPTPRPTPIRKWPNWLSCVWRGSSSCWRWWATGLDQVSSHTIWLTWQWPMLIESHLCFQLSWLICQVILRQQQQQTCPPRLSHQPLLLSSNSNKWWCPWWWWILPCLWCQTIWIIIISLTTTSMSMARHCHMPYHCQSNINRKTNSRPALVTDHTIVVIVKMVLIIIIVVITIKIMPLRNTVTAIDTEVQVSHLGLLLEMRHCKVHRICSLTWHWTKHIITQVTISIIMPQCLWVLIQIPITY